MRLIQSWSKILIFHGQTTVGRKNQKACKEKFLWTMKSALQKKEIRFLYFYLYTGNVFLGNALKDQEKYLDYSSKPYGCQRQKY